MPYSDDRYKLKDKSNPELRDWIADQEPGTDAYAAGLQESVRRVMVLEEMIEKSEDPVMHREWVVMGMAVVALALAIIAIVLTFEG